MESFFRIQDLQIDTGSTIYPFNKVSQIYCDFENDYFHVIMDNSQKFTINFRQYNAYTKWLSK